MKVNKLHKIQKLSKKISKHTSIKKEEPSPENEETIPPQFAFKMEEQLFEDDIIVTFEEPNEKANGQSNSENQNKEQTDNNNEIGDIEHFREQINIEIQNQKNQFSKKLLEKLKKIRKTVLFPNSILEPVQTIDLENQLIGKLARQFCMYRINSIMVFNDESYSYKKRQSGHDPSEFIVKILQYLETPQYLRKALFPISHLLKNAGLLNPLDCLHHLKVDDVSQYREGVILRRPIKDKDGSWADIGLYKVY